MIIIDNDNDVKSINEAQTAVAQRIFDQYPIKAPVYIFETIHGHIARFNFKEGRFIKQDENKPARQDAESLRFWSDIGEDLRWFEVGHGVIKVGLKDLP